LDLYSLGDPDMHIVGAFMFVAIPRRPRCGWPMRSPANATSEPGWPRLLDLSSLSLGGALHRPTCCSDRLVSGAGSSELVRQALDLASRIGLLHASYDVAMYLVATALLPDVTGAPSGIKSQYGPKDGARYRSPLPECPWR
jgi:hypothetical protein